MNGDWIDDGNEYPVIMQFPGNRFVVSSCCLHDNARIFTECEDLIRQTLQTDCIVHDIHGCLDYLTHMMEGNPCPENKELLIIPGAVHTDLYDKLDVIPFDQMENFFRKAMV